MNYSFLSRRSNTHTPAIRANRNIATAASEFVPRGVRTTSQPGSHRFTASMFDHGQDSQSLFKRIQQLEEQHKVDLKVIDQQKERITDLEQELRRLKNNYQKIDSKDLSKGEISSFYHDVFITDMNKEGQRKTDEANNLRVMTTQMQNELQVAKKDRFNMRQTLKRYRQFLSEVSNSSKMSPSSQLHGDTLSMTSEFSDPNRSQLKSTELPSLKGKMDGLHLTILQTASRDIAKAGKTVNAICEMLVKDSIKISDCEHVALYIVKKDIRVQFASEISYIPNNITIDKNKVIMFENRHTTINDPQFTVEQPYMRNLSCLCVPVMIGMQVAVVIQLQAKKAVATRKRGFTSEDESMMQILASAAATAFDRVLAYSKAKQSMQYFGQICEITNALCGARTHKEIANSVDKTLPAFFGFSKASIVFVNEQTNELYSLVPADKGQEAYSDEIIQFPTGVGITGSVASSGNIFSTAIVKKEIKYSQEIDNGLNIQDLNNMMFGCLTGAKGQTVGVLQLANKKGEISKDDKYKLEKISRLLGVCIDGTTDIMESMRLIIQLKSMISELMGAFSELETTTIDKDIHKLVNSMKGIKAIMTDGFRKR